MRRSAQPAFVGALAVCLTWVGFKELQPDSYRLLYAGRWIAQHGLPSHDGFTVAAGGRPFADQQWLSELLHYEAWRLAGYAGVVALSAVAFGLGYALITHVMRRRGVSPAVSVACGTLAIIGSLSLTFVRAQNLAIPLFALVLWLCLDQREGDAGRRIWLIPVVLALWANVHGSVLIGAAVAALFLSLRALRSRDARFACAAALCAASPLATPYGLHTLAYYTSMVGNAAVARADIEWDGPLVAPLALIQFLAPLLLAAGATALAARRGHRPPAVLVIAVLVTAMADLSAMRNGLWLAIAAALLIAETATAWLPTRELSPAFAKATAVGALALASTAAVLMVARGASGYQAHTPLRELSAASSYVGDHACARVMADTRSASALLWLHPELAGRVGFDGELEAYAPAALSAWVDFQSADQPDWLAAAHGYQVLIGSSHDQPLLVHRLTGLRDATLLAADRNGAAVVERNSQCVSG
jgi:hypothetical protein